jgi:release factor glutamine methyltransferase
VTRTLSRQSRLEAIEEATAVLEGAGVEHPRQDAEWLLASVLGVERFGVYLDPARELSRAEGLHYRSLVARRAGRAPLQHLLGFEEFHGVRLAVSPDALIPRPETEGLVRWVTEILRGEPTPVIVDVGTGTGAIACSLAHGLPALRVLAVDRSWSALAVAAKNVRALGLSGRVTLLAGDLLEPFRPCGLDLVVANLPYVPSRVVPSLPPEVSSFEPRLALDGGADGMALLRRLIVSAPAVLRSGGSLVMEIGEEQAGPLASLLAAEGFTGIESRRDLAGRERYIAGRWASEPVIAPRRTC